MEIKKVADGSALTIYISGRIDAVTALELDKNLQATLANVIDLTVDLADVEYVSSAGLRILLKTQKRMLDMTGFSDFLTIEDNKKAKFSVSF